MEFQLRFYRCRTVVENDLVLVEVDLLLKASHAAATAFTEGGPDGGYSSWVHNRRYSSKARGVGTSRWTQRPGCRSNGLFLARSSAHRVAACIQLEAQKCFFVPCMKMNIGVTSDDSPFHIFALFPHLPACCHTHDAPIRLPALPRWSIANVESDPPSNESRSAMCCIR